MKTYTFHTHLMDNTKVSRDLAVLENTSLYTLAEAIIDAYNFDFDHCFGFFSTVGEMAYMDSKKKYELFTDLIAGGENIEPTGAESVKKTRVKDVWQKVGETMMMLFDYGDNWRFVVTLQGMSEKDTKRRYPLLLRKVGRAPRQY